MKRFTLTLLFAVLASAGLALNFDRTVVVAASPADVNYAERALFGSTDALLLSCMDYRLTGFVTQFMAHDMEMAGKYDYVILAGASAGVNNTKYPNWGKTFFEHVDAAIALHHIHEVMIIDHRNCGAYKLFLNKEFAPDAAPAQLKEETAVHKEQLDLLAKTIHEKYPSLDVSTMLMNLDGSVEHIGDVKGTPKPADSH
jgi:carbonic anhydrase